MDGLYKKGRNWQLDKYIEGVRLCRSTGTADKKEAERRARKWVAEAEAQIYHGKRTVLTFGQACALYIEYYGDKISIDNDIDCLKRVMPYLEHSDIATIHESTFSPIRERLKETYKASSINRTIAVMQLILSHCEKTWRDQFHRPFLDKAPRLEKVREGDKEPYKPYTTMQLLALAESLNDNYRELMTFSLYTGLRDVSQSLLEWSQLKEVNGVYFFELPPSNMKSNRPFICVLNDVAAEIVNSRRGHNEKYVFISRLRTPYTEFNSTHFINARKYIGLYERSYAWHSNRTTFATKLREIGVSEEDRKSLLDHAGGMTSHYSVPQVMYLYAIVQKLIGVIPDLRKIPKKSRT